MPEVKEIIEKIGKEFHEFKAANDERLERIEKGQATAELEERVDKLSDAIQALDEIKTIIAELEARAARPGAPENEDPDKAAHRKAFESFIRKGKDDGLAELQLKALNVTTEGDGGFAVPEELDRSVLALLREGYAMRRLANNITVGTPDWKKLVNKHGATSGWVDEDDTRTETDTPALASVSAIMGEIYANPASTQTALDDMFFDAEGWLTEEIALAFAEGEGAAFVTGTGTKQPKGFLAYTLAATDDDTRDFGQLQYLNSEETNKIKYDDIIDMEFAIKEGYLANATYLMKRSTVKHVRKLKNGEGDYLWQPSLQANTPSLLNGYPLATDPTMPPVASGANAVAFADFKRGYYIVDRIGTRILRDPYSNKPYVHFYATKRVGGMVVDSNAIKVLKLTAAT